MSAAWKAKRPAVVLPLRCAKCGSTDVEADGSQQMLKVNGKKREHADVSCQGCGHEWWSRNPVALKRSREVDKARTSLL
jgi:predicted nucleic-acid-binding Zn-ribbon protein